jgi:hypothetical protein
VPLSAGGCADPLIRLADLKSGGFAHTLLGFAASAWRGY